MCSNKKKFSHKFFLVTQNFQSQKIFSHKKTLGGGGGFIDYITQFTENLVTKKLQSQKIFSHKNFLVTKNFIHKKVE